jgi:ATP-dependent DNA helicase RecG
MTFTRPKLKDGVRVKDKGKNEGENRGGLKHSEEGLVEGLVEGLAESQKAILTLVQSKPGIAKREMAEEIGISTTAIDKNIDVLKAKELLRRVGPAKGGHWEVRQ